MCFWKNLAKFVGMKQSIDFLPERKQRDLHELVGLIRDEVEDVVMIILYGSYARNTYVSSEPRLSGYLVRRSGLHRRKAHPT